MLDYEISGYIVYWKRPFMGKIVNRSKKFDTEEQAISFVKDFRSEWVEYRIEQRRNAIIDF